MCFHQAVDAKTRRFLPATATPALDINRLLGILSGSADDGADTLDGLPPRIIKKMRVPARCDRIRVAQKRADQRQARAGRYGSFESRSERDLADMGMTRIDGPRLDDARSPHSS